MGWFSKKKNTISVEFYERGASIPFAKSKVPIEQLPDSFEIQTQLEIKEKPYNVIEASPALKTEFAKTGKLKIILQEVQIMKTNELLFSLPTVSNSLFAMETASSGENLLLIYGDDWRQIEFISASQIDDIKREIELINAIYEHHRVSIGFDQIHMRELIEHPLLDAKINLEELKRELAITKEYDGFGVADEKSKAVNGFAFQVADGFTFYGQAENGFVSFLCIYEPVDSNESIGKIIDKHNLFYVDWCACEVFSK